MPTVLVKRFCTIALCGAAALGLTGCEHAATDPSLAKTTQKVVRTAKVPDENGPKLGAVSELLQVHEATDKLAPSIGVLHAGALVARSGEPVSSNGCEGGWYAIRPRGFVCAGPQATLDLGHPTLVAMALSPKVDAKLPYTYARARVETPLWERASGREDAVRELGKLRRRAGLAVVGSWKASDPNGTETRLALLTSGRFVRAEDLEAAKPSEFAGVELGKTADLPIGFVVKRGVRSFRLSKGEAEKGDLLDYHSRLALSGRFRSLGDVKYWAIDAGEKKAASEASENWVRHRDVTVLQKRTTFPDFARDDARWLDISVVTGSLVAYEGRRPVFATLVSVARERSEGETVNAAGGSTIPLGSFSIRRKHVTLPNKEAFGFGESYELFDVPWALELNDGQLIHGAYWHDRFGIEQGAGSFALSPADAARLFQFVAPDLPQGWHSASVLPNEPSTQVVIRK